MVQSTWLKAPKFMRNGTRIYLNIANVIAAQAHRSGNRVIQPSHEFDEGALSGSILSGDRDVSPAVIRREGIESRSLFLEYPNSTSRNSTSAECALESISAPEALAMLGRRLNEAST